MGGGAGESVMRMRPSWASRFAFLAPMLSLVVFATWQMTPHPGDLGKSAWGYGVSVAILGAQCFIAAHSGITLTPAEAVVHRPLHRERRVPWADVEAVVITRSPFGQVMLATTSGAGIVVPVLTLNRRRLDAIRTKIDQCRTGHRDPVR